MLAMTADTAQALPERNATSVEFPNVCAHELFEQQVARTPEALAVVFNEQRLNYRALNERANQVAHCLRRRGIGPESLVGVAVRHSPAMLIGLLGIWKAGAAYVPLDPAFPPERLAYMVRDTELRVLLTEQKFTALFSATTAKAICLDTDWPSIAQESSSNPHSVASPANLAYAMYASDSTGQPKATMIGHGGLVNYLCWAIAAYGLEKGCSVPVHSSISFDLTVTSLYPPLLVGGHVVLLAQNGAQNPVAALRRTDQRDLVKITPAHLDLLSQQLTPAEMATVSKLCVIGGEAILAENLAPEFVPPRTPAEEKLAAIWCTLLNLEQIDIHDDLFDLGAHSLQAVKAVAQIRAECAVDLQLRNLFEQPTIAGLATVIDGLSSIDPPRSTTHDPRDREEVAL